MPGNLTDFGANLGHFLGQPNYTASLDSTGKVPAAQISVSTPTVLSGAVVQMVSISVKGFTTTDGVHAGGFDNKPITSVEGSTFGLSLNMKPTSTANRIYVIGEFYVSNSVDEANFWGLFLAGSTSAVIAGGDNTVRIAQLDKMHPMSFHWQATTVSAATTTYAVNIGAANSGSTCTLNGEAGAARFANTVQSSLTVWEIQN